MNDPRECDNCFELVEFAGDTLCAKHKALKEMWQNEQDEMELVENMRSLVVNEDGTMEWVGPVVLEEREEDNEPNGWAESWEPTEAEDD